MKLFSALIFLPFSMTALTGQATYYGGNIQGGACLFSTYSPPIQHKLAISDTNWDGSMACGGCISVTGPKGNSITAMVVDECPGCGANHLDLFRPAFAALDDHNKGVIPVSWDWVPCPITSSISLRAKEGASQWWFSLQVMNSAVRVQSMQVSTDGGSSWQGTVRRDYNFFGKADNGGFGTQTVKVKLTGVNGQSLVVSNVGVNGGTVTSANGNLG